MWDRSLFYRILNTCTHLAKCQLSAVVVNLGLIKLFLLQGVPVDVSGDVITVQIQHSLQSIGLVR